MLKSNLLTVAESVIIDENSKSVSIINIIEDLVVEAVPIIIPKVAVFCLVKKDDADKNDSYEIFFKISVNEQMTFSTPFKINFLNKLRNRTVLNLGGLQIPDFGVVKFEVFYQDSILNSYSINVMSRSTLEVRS